MVTFSLVIPYFNGARTINRALLSIEQQTRKPKIVIIVDDGSDKVLEKPQLQEFSFPIEIIRIENSGQSTARNVGAKTVNTDFVAFLDQDDQLKPEHFASLINNITEGCSFVFSDFDLHRPNAKSVMGFRTRVAKLISLNTVSHAAKHDLYILPSCLFIKKNALLEVGGFNPELRGYEDDDLVLRLLQSGHKGEFTKTSTVNWIHSPESSSNDIRMSESRQVFATIWFSRLTSVNSQAKLLGRVTLPILKQLIATRERKEALKRLRRLVDEIDKLSVLPRYQVVVLIILGTVAVLQRNLDLVVRSYFKRSTTDKTS